MYVHHIYAWYPWRLEEGIRAPGLELQVVVSYHASARNQTQVLCKSIVLLTTELFSPVQNVDKDPRDRYTDKDLCTQRRFHLQYKARPQKMIS